MAVSRCGHCGLTRLMFISSAATSILAMRKGLMVRHRQFDERPPSAPTRMTSFSSSKSVMVEDHGDAVLGRLALLEPALEGGCPRRRGLFERLERFALFPQSFFFWRPTAWRRLTLSAASLSDIRPQ
jgi:hypothetical protein